jgi:hypothetical protein
MVGGVVVIPATPVGGSSPPAINSVGLGADYDDSQAQHFTLTEIDTYTRPYVITPPVGTTNYPGETVSLSVFAGGYPNPTYQWQLNSSNLLTATTASLVVSNLASSNSGTYTVIISNSLGSVASAVEVLVAPPVTNIIYQDSFSGSGALNGRTPDTAGTQPWIAAANWTVGSGVATATAAAGGADAYLPFIPSAGKVYTLSAYLNDAGASAWLALGYTGADPTTGEWYNAADPVGWVLQSAGGGPDDYYIGPGLGATGQIGTGPATFATILDTRPTLPQNWTVSYQVNGVTELAATAIGTSPTINYVGLGEYSNDVVMASNLILSVTYAPTAPYFVTQPQSPYSFYPAGGAVTLSALGGGGASPLTYQWLQNSSSVSGATTASLALSPLAATNSGTYEIVISDNVSSVTSAPVVLDVVVPLTNTLYEDNFTGPVGPLNGRTPDTVGTNQWVASAYWSTDGTSNAVVDAGDTISTGPDAFLPFVPLQGRIYTLSVTLGNTSVSGDWIAMGYGAKDPTEGNWLEDDTHTGEFVDPVGWIITFTDYGGDANYFFLGPGTGGIEGISYPYGPELFTSILDTRASLPGDWTFTAIVSSTGVNGATNSFGPQAFGGTGPAIAYVGLTDYEGVTPITADAFTLIEQFAPPVLTISVSGSHGILTWNEGVLESATQLNGTWSAVAGAVSPYTISFSGTQKFYRVVTQ